MAINDMQKAIEEYQNLISAATEAWQNQVLAAEAEFLSAVQTAADAGVDSPLEQFPDTAPKAKSVPVTSALQLPKGKMLMDEAVYNDLLDKLTKVDKVMQDNPALFANL